MHAEIERLPPLQRMLLTMHHMEELSVSEMAAICDLPEGTIKSHLFRSRARLRERLQPRWEEKA